MANGTIDPMLIKLLGAGAQMVAPDSIGAKMGSMAVQQNESNVLADKQSEDAARRQAVLEQLGGLTGEGVQTTGVKIGPKGELTVTGTLAPTEADPGAENAVQTAPQELQNTTQGGGQNSTSPFYQMLWGQDRKRL